MIFRKFSMITAKYLVIALCLITVLLSTPWGSQLTLALLSTIEGISIDYRSGVLVNKVRLNSLYLHLEDLEITVEDMSADINLNCIWKKTLCFTSAEAEYFSLHYRSNNVPENGQVTKQTSRENTNNSLFVMPFSIQVNSISLKKSQLVIDNTQISIDQFISQVSIEKSEFYIQKPTAQTLTWSIDNKTQAPYSASPKSGNSINNAINQLPEIYLPIALNIEKLHINTIDIRTKDIHNNQCQQLCTLWLSTNNNLSGSWAKTDVIIREFQSVASSFAIHKLSGQVNLQPPYQITSNSVSQHHDVSWWPEIAGSTAKLSLIGSLDDLKFDLVSEGNLALESKGEIDLIHENMPFTVSVNSKKIPTPLTLSHLGHYSSLSLLLSGDLVEQTIELTSQITGYGYANAHINVKANRKEEHLNIEHFFLNDIASSSQLSLQGKLSVLPDDLSWHLTAKSSGFTFPEINLQNLPEVKQTVEDSGYLARNLPETITGRLQGAITSKGKWANDSWSITFIDTDLSGNINALPLTLQADIGVNQSGDLQPGSLFLDFNGASLALQTNTKRFWDMKGQLNINDLHQWHSDIDGKLNSSFSVSGEQSNPTIKLETQLNELNWRDWTSNLVIIEADYQPMKNHKLKLSLKNDHINWGNDNQDFNVEKLSLTVQGDTNKHQINANWLGDFTGNLSLSGQLNEALTHWQTVIEQSDLSYQNITLKNTDAFDMNFDLTSKQTFIAKHCWRGTGLGVCLSDEATLGHSGDIAINLDLELAVIDELFLPQDTELISQISGDINIKWAQQEKITAKANFEMSPGYLKVSDSFNEHKISQWSHGKLAFDIDKKSFSHTLLLKDLDNIPLVNINSSIQLIEDSTIGELPVEAQLILNNFNLQPFQSILADVITLQGKVTANISVDGTIESPLFNGNISLDKGSLSLRQNANAIENMSSSLNVNGNSASIDGNFYLKDKEANLQGDISWHDGLAMNIDLTGSSLPLVFPPQLLMSASPKLNFSLIKKSLTISGDIDVVEGTYNIEKLPQSSVSLSDDVLIIDDDGKAIVKESTGFDIITDINIKIAPEFKISGQGLQGQLFGQLHISQQEKHPFQMFGRIQSSNGTFQAYGQRLNIDTGELTFNGPLDNPYFNLRASRHIRAEDIDVGIKVTGFADALDMKLFSSPTMTMPEMLSYLVRGRSLDAGTENSTAAASLLIGFGATNSAGLFEQIERIPLISNIAVDTEGEGEKTQATVSGYLGDRVYLKYGIGVYEPINELTVRMFILNRFWLEIVSGIEQSTDFYYSFYLD